jgi:hypothetical protein
VLPDWDWLRLTLHQMEERDREVEQLRRAWMQKAAAWLCDKQQQVALQAKSAASLEWDKRELERFNKDSLTW